MTTKPAKRMNRNMLVYKIFRPAEFEAFQRDGRSLGAPVDLADGYIHLSSAEQLSGTLSKHFAAEDRLHLLALESGGLDSLRWKPSRGGALFPHLYRELRRDDILWTRTLALGPDGHDIGDVA